VGAGLGDRRRALDFIDEFAAAWTRPLVREDGYGEDVLRSVEEHLGVQLPAALREAYLVLGRRTDLTAVQDPLLPLDRVRVDQAEAVIVFRIDLAYGHQPSVVRPELERGNASLPRHGL